nr:FTR1 family protein [Treponema putidum]
MISKSETEAWERYIQKKVESSVSTGNKWVLIFAAFIAVAREGAELILFFQGVPVQGASGQRAMILAVVLSVVILAGVFLAFRFLSVKLPLKPFFTVTSILMYILCFSFTGKGVSELQAAGVVSKTIIPWMQSFELDFLGIYATYESLIPQIIVLVAIIVFSSLYVKKNKKILAELKKKEGENN